MRDALRVMSPGATTASRTPAASMRLLRLMTDAGRHVPLYRRLWAASGIDVDDLQVAGDFQRLPWLDKAALRACRPEDRIHGKRRDIHLAEELSSGSSGEPLTVFKDRAAQLRRRWAFLRALLACGYRPGQRCLLLTSRRSAKWPAVARWSYASIGEDTATLASRLEALQPDVLYGPLSTLELLAAQLDATDAATDRAAPRHLDGGAVDAAAPRNPRAGIRRSRRRFLRHDRARPGRVPTARESAFHAGAVQPAARILSHRRRAVDRAPGRHRPCRAHFALDSLRHGGSRQARPAACRAPDRGVRRTVDGLHRAAGRRTDFSRTASTSCSSKCLA